MRSFLVFLLYRGLLFLVMANGKKSFLLYTDIFFTVEKLSDENAGALFKTILAYVNDKNPVVKDPLIEIAFEPIKQSLKRDLRKYEEIREKRREAGKASADKRQQVSTSVDNDEQVSTSATVNDNVIVNVNDSVNVNKEKKIKYADFVSMTPEEYDKLVQKHGSDNTTVLIDILNSYKGSNGKKYKSDYLAILNWVVDRAKKDGKIRMRVLA